MDRATCVNHMNPLIKIIHRFHLKFDRMELIKFIGPAFLVTAGFIDPGNWATNVAAGSQFGYELLWIVTIATLMLIILQHNAAHLGIATGLCISEASTKYHRRWVNKILLMTAMGASISTALAELLGAAIGLNMLFGLPLVLGAAISMIVVATMLFTNSYRKLERWIIAFVSLIGFSFVYELTLCDVSWPSALKGAVIPSFPPGSIFIIMGVLGAIVMPHNLFLHSEVIQSRHWNLKDEKVIKRQLRYEFLDTIMAMALGWGINGAIVVVAASVFFTQGIVVTELSEAHETLAPLLGDAASNIFAFALICAGIASSITAALAGGSIFSGMAGQSLDVRVKSSQIGITITLVGAFIAILFIGDTFQALIWSQVALSIQLPITVFGLISLTSSKKIMGKYVNSKFDNGSQLTIGIVLTILNAVMLWGIVKG